MNLLITGGAGFIGRHLCEYYLSRGARVTCLDNLCTGSEKNIAAFSANPDFTFLQEDLITFDLSSLSSDFSLIFHCASPASPPDYFRLPIETLRVNSIGTEKCLKFALQQKATILFTSTSEVYGDPAIGLQNEEYWGNVNPIGPRSVYDEAKRYGEALMMAYHRSYHANIRIVRIFNTYGPYMRIEDGRVVPNFIAQALSGKALTIYGDGNQTRSFCYIEDLIKGITRITEIEYHLPVNLGNPSEFTVIELAKLIQNIIGDTSLSFLPPLEDDPKRRKPDIAKAIKLLGWQPQISLKEGLQRTVAYFTAQKVSPSQ
ncbi:MAG: NAD-dependent epimerase/dehydratase family protein [Candidatus Ratteibacteria bacterium]